MTTFTQPADHEFSRWMTLRPEHFDKYLTFTDYASYLEWMRKWKFSYKSLSGEIRYQKAQIKDAQRLGDLNSAAVLMSERVRLRWRAFLMIQLRAHGKRRSEEQRQTRLQQV